MSATFLQVGLDGGCLTEKIIADFYGKKCFKAVDVYRPSLLTDGTRFVINGKYIYKHTIVQFLVIPTQNCVLNAGKLLRNIFSCNIFVSLLIFTAFLMIEIKK